MQTTPDDGLWKVQKRSGNFGTFIHQFQPETKETWKDLNKIIETKCVFIIQSNMLKWKTASHTHMHTHTHIYYYFCP